MRALAVLLLLALMTACGSPDSPQTAAECTPCDARVCKPTSTNPHCPQPPPTPDPVPTPTPVPPTPGVTQLDWDRYTDPAGVGFYVYWRVGLDSYTSSSRSQITDPTQTSVLISALVSTVPGQTMCFVMTAYNVNGTESPYSNEVCGTT